MRWLDGTPRAILRAHIRALPRLDARDALRAVREIALGTGLLGGDALRDAVEAWREVAGIEAAPARSRSLAALKSAASGLRIGVHTVQARKP
jgi:hypothetical protein